MQKRTGIAHNVVGRSPSAMRRSNRIRRALQTVAHDDVLVFEMRIEDPREFFAVSLAERCQDLLKLHNAAAQRSSDLLAR